MKFKDVYKAVSNGNWKDIPHFDLYEAVVRQRVNLDQQREGLLKCLFGTKRSKSGRGAKITMSDYDSAKGGFAGLIGSDRILNKSKTVVDLHEKLLLVERRLGMVK